MINFRTYPGDQRAAVRDMKAVPDGSFYPKRMEGPYTGYPGADTGDDDTPPNSDYRNNYNMELIGYFYPPKTGKVQFALATDDPGELWVSTDDNPANKVRVATEGSWNPVRAFLGGDPTAPTRRSVVTTGDPPTPRPSNWSPWINVVAGKPYFIQSIATEFGGGDNNAVAFRYEGDPDFEDRTTSDTGKPIPGKYLAPFFNPTTPTIMGQPADVFAFAGGDASFSVAVDVGAAGTVSSYKWQKNGTDVPNSNSATLSLSKVTAADDGAKYKAIITTSIGNVTSAEATLNVSAIATAFAPGVMKLELWNGINGVDLQALKDDPRYPATPDEVRLRFGYEAPINFRDNFGGKISGFIVPQETGNYVFFVGADDHAELYLSTDENPANKKMIAQETAWGNTRQWTTSSGNSDLESKRSDKFSGTEWPTGNKITLTAGKKYYTELLYKEGGGGDNAAATMIKEGAPDPAAGTLTLTRELIGGNAQPTKGDVQITQQPNFPAQLEEGRTYRVTVDGITTPAGYNFPLIIQWQKNGAAIPGATGKTLLIQSAKASDAGTYRAVLSTSSGKSVNSTEKALTVVPDTFPPVPSAGALLKSGKQEIGVGFDEAVKIATATVLANYSLSAGTLESVRTVNRPATGFDASLGVQAYDGVVLVASGLTAGQNYTLTVKNVEDLKGNKIAAAGVTTSFKAEDKKTWTVVGANESKFANDVVRHADGSFDVISSGVAFWADYDEATFVNEKVAGNFDAKVQLIEQDPSSQWARTGLMAREALDEGKARITRSGESGALVGGVYTIPKEQLFSRLQTVHANPTIRWDVGTANNGWENHFRDESTHSLTWDNQMQSADGGFSPLDYPNIWMRLQRVGNILNTFRSADGQTWIPMTSRQFSSLAADLYIGPFSAPELLNNGTKDGLGHAVLAKFRNYSITTGSTPPPGGKFTGIKVQGANVVIDFSGSGVQSASSITGPWTDVTGSSPLTVPVSGAPKFYRFKP